MSRVRQLQLEVQRLQSAVSAIHDRLHADDVNGAHELCECAINGGSVTQPNLSEEDGSDVIAFAAAFNALAERHRMMACVVTLMPSATVPGAVSLQLAGNVTACRVVEEQIRGRASTYMGEHHE
jgi:hypothetical protein